MHACIINTITVHTQTMMRFQNQTNPQNNTKQQKQGGLLALLILGRLALLRWQLQTYLEYGGVLALYAELARCGKPEEIDNLGIRMLFQVRGCGCVGVWNVDVDCCVGLGCEGVGRRMCVCVHTDHKAHADELPHIISNTTRPPQNQK